MKTIDNWANYLSQNYTVSKENGTTVYVRNDERQEKDNLKFLPDGFMNDCVYSFSEQLEHEFTSDELQMRYNAVRRDRLSIIMPEMLKKHGIDMFIYVLRSNNAVFPEADDSMAREFGAREGVFVFSISNGQYEKAVFDFTDADIAKLGVYDVVFRPRRRITLNAFFATVGIEYCGDKNTEFDFRFEGLDRYIAHRNPKKIALNFFEKLGGPVEFEPSMRADGISLTDYKLLTKKIGSNYASRIISGEYLLFDYISRPVPSEIEYTKLIRKDIRRTNYNAFMAIIPGVTKVGDCPHFRQGYRKNGDRLGNADDVFMRGDFIAMEAGLQSLYDDPCWPYGNEAEVSFDYFYIPEEGETEIPACYKEAWEHVLEVRKIIDKCVIAGHTGIEVLEDIRHQLAKKNYLMLNDQEFRQDDPRIQVPIDMHAAGKGYYAPRIGYMGPDWAREMVLPPMHHFFNEFWVYIRIPSWEDGKFLSIQFHDGAFATENGTVYPSPFPSEVILWREN